MSNYSPLNPAELIKNTSHSNSKTVVLVGNGALENGWLPLRGVLDEWIASGPEITEKIKKLRGQNSEALHQLAGLSCEFKMTRGMLYKSWLQGTSLEKTIEGEAIPRAMSEFLSIRKKIGAAYEKESHGLVLNDEKSIRKLIGEDATYITTNWDNTLWMEKDIKKLIYLHGRCSHPDSLIFPTELIIEDIAFDCPFLLEQTQNSSRSFQKLMLSSFRCETVEALYEAHVEARRVVSEAERLVIWGYSLVDFDADVNVLIRASMRPEKVKELIVINTDPYAFQRAIALTGIEKAILYNPNPGFTLKMA